MKYKDKKHIQHHLYTHSLSLSLSHTHTHTLALTLTLKLKLTCTLIQILDIYKYYLHIVMHKIQSEPPVHLLSTLCLLLALQLVPEVHIIGGLEDAQAGA